MDKIIDKFSFLDKKVAGITATISILVTILLRVGGVI